MHDRTSRLSTRRVAVGRLAWLVAIATLGGCQKSDPPTGNPDRLTSPAAREGAPIVAATASAQDADPREAGRKAAEALKEKLGGTSPRLVVLSECFETEEAKRHALESVRSVLSPPILVGQSTYGSFSQAGCLDVDAITLLAIGGDGVGVTAALKEPLGIGGLTMETDEAALSDRLSTAGADLAERVRSPEGKGDRILLLLADAHSPKNGFLVDGAQRTLGGSFPITGGSANKNAGQTFVYFNDRMLPDAAVAVMLSGDFSVAMAGRQAKEADAVIATAGEAASEARKGLTGTPIAALAYDCAGRQGKLERLEDELGAMQAAVGKDLPLFGCYCAGEIGPTDAVEPEEGVLSHGVGWHVMFTLLGREG